MSFLNKLSSLKIKDLLGHHWRWSGLDTTDPDRAEVEMYVELIVQELTRMGIYYAKQDIYRRKIERVKIRSTKALPDQIEIEINTDDLPKWITTAHLANPDTVHSLGMVCGRKISVIDEEEKGFWYVIPR